MEATSTTAPTVFTAEQIASLPEVALGTGGGVTHRVLWTDGASMAGVLHVPAGGSLGAHAHRVNHHHLWVLEGHADVLGQRVGPGSFVHVPAHVDHDIDATATEGCTVYYLYLRPGT